MTEIDPNLPRIAVLEDDEAFASVLCRGLRRRGFQVEHFPTVNQLQQQLGDADFDWFILDLKVDQDSSLPLVQPIREHYPKSKILMLTGYASIATTVESIKLGADNYLPKPADVEDILKAFDHTAPDPQASVSEKPMSVDRLEWEHIQRVLAENDGNISKTAKQLNMHRRTLQRKLQKRPVSE